MPGFNFTTTGEGGLIDSVQIRAMMPLNQDTFTSARILTLADEELQTVIAPMIMAVGGDYFLTDRDQTMSQNETVYSIPSDAIGLGIKDVWFVDPNTNQKTLIPRINSQSAQNNWVGTPYFTGYYIQNNNVVLFPQSSTSFTLRMRIFKRAPKLVLTTACGQVTDVDTVLNTVTLDNVPTTWAVNDEVDAIDEDPGFLTLAEGRVISNIAGLTLTLDDVTDIAVGNWVAMNGESPIPQINPEAIPILAQSVAVKALEALSDPKVEVAQAKFKQLQDAFIKMMTPRAQAQPNKVVDVNGNILGWSSMWPWPWWGGF